MDHEHHPELLAKLGVAHAPGAVELDQVLARLSLEELVHPRRVPELEDPGPEALMERRDVLEIPLRESTALVCLAEVREGDEADEVTQRVPDGLRFRQPHLREGHRDAVELGYLAVDLRGCRSVDVRVDVQNAPRPGRQRRCGQLLGHRAIVQPEPVARPHPGGNGPVIRQH